MNSERDVHREEIDGSGNESVFDWQDAIRDVQRVEEVKE